MAGDDASIGRLSSLKGLGFDGAGLATSFSFGTLNLPSGKLSLSHGRLVPQRRSFSLRMVRLATRLIVRMCGFVPRLGVIRFRSHRKTRLFRRINTQSTNARTRRRRVDLPLAQDAAQRSPGSGRTKEQSRLQPAARFPVRRLVRTQIIAAAPAKPCRP